MPRSHATNGKPRHSNRGRSPLGLVEDVRRQILCFFAVSHATCDVGVDSFKIVLVQLGKARCILLRRLDLEPLIVLVRQVLVFQRLQSVLRGTSFLIR